MSRFIELHRDKKGFTINADCIVSFERCGNKAFGNTTIKVAWKDGILVDADETYEQVQELLEG